MIKHKHLALPILITIFTLMSLPLVAASAHPAVQQPQPTPTVDRLAIPTLPANPTQLDIGNSLYYYHCMPCHGDYGQGLTDEFREIWEEDHQNCWGRGCHAGRERDEGFPIPTVIPAVNKPAISQALFPTQNDLFAYLKATHPPQYPGKLKDEEYQALAAYTFALAGRDEALQAGPNAAEGWSPAALWLGVVLLGTILVVGSLFRQG